MTDSGPEIGDSDSLMITTCPRIPTAEDVPNGAQALEASASTDGTNFPNVPVLDLNPEVARANKPSTDHACTLFFLDPSFMSSVRSTAAVCSNS